MLTAEEAVKEILHFSGEQQRTGNTSVGILFGREKGGLRKEVKFKFSFTPLHYLSS